jgi:hypothetical protein
MAALTVMLKQGDTHMIFTDTGTINGVPLTPSQVVGATLNWIMRSFDGLTQLKNAATINADATFSYQVTASDVNTPGKFQQEWELIFPNGQTLTFPNQNYNIVNILPELG